MVRRLPPLSALRAFEATARHQSVARAAEELHVTPAAVSHHIRKLEEWLGLRLFQRLKGQFRLAPAGKTYLATIGVAFNQIWDATERLAASDSERIVTFLGPPSFIAKWLVPRIPAFQKAHPRIDLRVVGLTQPIDLTQQVVDIAIGFGWEAPADMVRIPWLRYEVFPVCSPKLRNELSIRKPADLPRYPLIHDEGLRVYDQIDWDTYLRAAGVAKADVSRGLRVNAASVAYDMAIGGHGIVLARSVLVQTDLESGQLVRLFDLALPGEISYDIIYPEHAITASRVRAVKDWLQSQSVAASTAA
jgi:LysR family glycine cleavage system transcriptional activator